MDNKEKIILILSNLKSDYKTESGDTRPYRFEDFLIQYAESRNIGIVGNKFPIPSRTKSYVTIEYGPTLRTIFQKSLGVRYIYIHWGIAKSTNFVTDLLRKIRYYLIFKYSSLVLVNDGISFDEVKKICPYSRIIKFKYPMDVEFYSQDFSNTYGRKDSPFFYAPGSAFRDDELILKISRSGLKIIRTVQNTRIFNKYSVFNGANYMIMNDVSLKQVFDFYKDAAAIVLPLTEGGSASGQHVILEAILLRKYIFVTKNRISIEFKDYPNVILVNSKKVEDWRQLLSKFSSLITAGSAENIDLDLSALTYDTQDLFEAIDSIVMAKKNN